MTSDAFFCRLDHESVLAVRGPDAGKFLQGQLTCNIDYLGDEHSSLGARCNIKGRMLASFRIVRDGDGYLLAMATALLEPLLADLRKYAVFSKVTLEDESARRARFGLMGRLEETSPLQLAEESGAVTREDGHLGIRLDADRAELWVPTVEADRLQQRLAEQRQECALPTWQLAQIRAGIGQVLAETRELFIPQMINLQAVGGVSFRKGCYTGQEIVARMQYLGRLKRRLYRLAMEGTEAPVPGTQLFSPVHASSVGEVVLAAPAGTTVEMLAVVQEDAIADGRLHLDSKEGTTLQLLDLPYALDPDREIRR